MLLVALVMLALVPVLGGDVRRLSGLRLRWSWLVFVALAVQVLVISLIPSMARGWDAAAHVLTYVGALVVVGVNWRVPGLLAVGAGTALNGIAIAANGGTLPASQSALDAAGIHYPPSVFVNSGALAHPHLSWLGDRFVSPTFLPLHNVVSIGDLLILAGVAVLLVRVCGVTLRSVLRRPRPAPAS